MVVDVIIPALNEEHSIAKVVNALPKQLLHEIIVVDNNSSDQTAVNAKKAGAVVLSETRRGYGAACLRGVEYLKSKSVQPDVVVFIDGDFSDYPQELPLLLQPIVDDDIDLVLGSRTLGEREPGSLGPHQRFGNGLATMLVRWFYGFDFTDLGPFRAIKFDELLKLGMVDQNYGWTIEMQVKAVKRRLKIKEVPVSYRNRIGTSKVSGTINGSVLAGLKIISTLIRYA